MHQRRPSFPLLGWSEFMRSRMMLTVVASAFLATAQTIRCREEGTLTFRSIGDESKTPRSLSAEDFAFAWKLRSGTCRSKAKSRFTR